jgi:hypothetical protein
MVMKDAIESGDGFRNDQASRRAGGGTRRVIRAVALPL